jgi:hypothetical protein
MGTYGCYLLIGLRPHRIVAEKYGMAHAFQLLSLNSWNGPYDKEKSFRLPDPVQKAKTLWALALLLSLS